MNQSLLLAWWLCCCFSWCLLLLLEAHIVALTHSLIHSKPFHPIDRLTQGAAIYTVLVSNLNLVGAPCTAVVMGVVMLVALLLPHITDLTPVAITLGSMTFFIEVNYIDFASYWDYSKVGSGLMCAMLVRQSDSINFLGSNNQCLTVCCCCCCCCCMLL